MKEGDKCEYCITGNFCSPTFMDATCGWPYIKDEGGRLYRGLTVFPSKRKLMSLVHIVTKQKTVKQQKNAAPALSKRKWMMKFLVEQTLLHRKLRLNCWHTYFVVVKSQVQTLALRLAILDGGFSCFSLVTPEKWQSSTCKCITTLYSTPSVIHYSVNTSSIHAIKSTLLRLSFSKL